MLLVIYGCIRSGQTVLGKGHKIKKFENLDFSAIRKHLDTLKQIKRAATDGEKAAAKTIKEDISVCVCAFILQIQYI